MFDIKDNAILLPEIQFEYAVLDFANLHISKKVKKLLKENNFLFKIDYDFESCLNKIIDYHKDSWLCEEYQSLLKKLISSKFNNFKLSSIELYDKKNNFISGEIGYFIGKTYTSLTGFTCRKKEYNNWGKLQLVLLSKYLYKGGYDFWNLGHASLKYKLDLGAKVLSRKDFIQRWKISSQKIIFK